MSLITNILNKISGKKQLAKSNYASTVSGSNDIGNAINGTNAKLAKVNLDAVPENEFKKAYTFDFA